MDIEINIPQEDHKRFSRLINATKGMNTNGYSKENDEGCGRYGEGFMVNYSLLIPLNISVPEPTTLAMDEIIHQIKDYLAGQEKSIAVTNVNGDKILFQSPLSEQNKQDLKNLFRNFF